MRVVARQKSIQSNLSTLSATTEAAMVGHRGSSFATRATMAAHPVVRGLSIAASPITAAAGHGRQQRPPP